MIFGAHIITYTKNADADRAFFRDILGFNSVDAGDSWLIFALPPCEIAFHPSENSDPREFYLMCNNLESEIARLKQNGVKCSEIVHAGWGSLTKFRLPGGGEVGLYQPRHPTAISNDPGREET